MKASTIIRKCWLLIPLGILLWLACTIFHPFEPRYQGRSLISWLQQYYYTPLDDPQRRQEAHAAIQAIGVKKVLQCSLKLVEATDDPVSLWIIDRTDKFRIRFLKWDSVEDYQRIRWHSAEDFQQLGIAGFEVLGTNAGPAVGELAKLLDEKDHNFTAERCLVFIGKPAEIVFCRALTNQDWRVRQWGMDELASVTDDVEVYIARIKDRLMDSSDAVRVTAVDDIGIQTSAPELAVPLLVAALKDSSDSVSSHAADSLANFGTNALGLFLTLSNLVESGSGSTASAALKTLVIIAPNESLPILTNCIARGKPATDGALQALADAAPEKALPIILDRVQSPDPGQQRAAFRLLCHYPMTSKIESAMQTAAADSDSDIAKRAKEILTEKYQKEHPLESQFPDELSYGGKPLGEWLKAHDREGKFSKDAEDALRQMGTNAIPALLKRLVYVQPPFDLRAFDVNIDAVRGFIILGEQAMPALPRLQTFMDSTNGDIALCAMLASCGTGSNAVPILIKGLTNQFPDVRNEAAHYLTDGPCAQFPEQRKQAIPLFVKLLNDPDDDVRGNATNELKEIDPEAAAKAGIK
jgi:HEAT repeat protein